jgi:hypothetical protein
LISRMLHRRSTGRCRERGGLGGCDESGEMRSGVSRKLAAKSVLVPTRNRDGDG